MEWLAVAATAFALVVPVELPDKTFVATLVLATRHPPLPVWLGVASAFGVQCLVATAAGRLVGLLPDRPVKLAAAALFAMGAVVLVRQALASARLPDAGSATRLDRPGATGVRAAASSFLVLFAAEWGDLSQLLTAGLVASGKPAVPVFVGSWLGLAAVAGGAVLVGRALLRRVDAAALRYAGAGVCALLAGLTLWSAW
jgi:Ca2+/H+ antiporter, TMEM165/GDT1 family